MKAIFTLLAVSMLLAGVTAVYAEDDEVNLTTVDQNITEPVSLDQNTSEVVSEVAAEAAPVAASEDQALDVISTSTISDSAEKATLDLSTESSDTAVLDLSTLGKKKSLSNVNVLALGGSRPTVYTPSFSIRNNATEISSTVAPTVYTMPVAIGSNATTVYTPPFAISNIA